MRFYQVGVPLIVIALLGLILLGFALWWRRREAQIEREELLEKKRNWEGVCHFDDPNTGTKCQREEFHLENHYHYVNGKLVTW